MHVLLRRRTHSTGAPLYRTIAKPWRALHRRMAHHCHPHIRGETTKKKPLINSRQKRRQHMMCRPKLPIPSWSRHRSHLVPMEKQDEAVAEAPKDEATPGRGPPQLGQGRLPLLLPKWPLRCRVKIGLPIVQSQPDSDRHRYLRHCLSDAFPRRRSHHGVEYGDQFC